MLEWARVDVSGQVAVGAPVRIGFVVRNASAASTAPATEVAIQTLGYAGGEVRPEPAAYRFTLPSLPPGAVLTGSVEALGLTPGGGFFDVALAAGPDRAHKREWGSVAGHYPTQPTRVRVGAGR